MTMPGHIRRVHLFLVAITCVVVAPSMSAQTTALHSDSLRLRYMRIRAQATTSCQVVVNTSGSMDIQAEISPANVYRWIDTAKAYADSKPQRAKGQRIRYAWIPLTLGISRTITDRFDAFEFAISGHGIPILRGEILKIATLLDSAAAETLRRSRVKGGCPTAPDAETFAQAVARFAHAGAAMLASSASHSATPARSPIACRMSRLC